MAEAFLQVLIDNLSCLIQKEIGLIMGVDKEMKKLQSTLTTIQTVLEDAEDKQFRNKPIQNWLRKLNDTAYEIEDLLDECSIELSRGRKFNAKKILFSHKIGRRMKEMAERLDDLAAERHNFHLHEIFVPPRRRETGFILSEPNHVYGRDDDKEEIVDVLVNRVAECEQLSVLPIVGIGGLGKTTLAQLVFNETRVSQHFEMKIWVCVSNDFDMKVLLKAIIEFAGGSGVDLTEVAALQRRLREMLSRRRYLLVLDDVWNENQESWALFKSVMECGSKGASVVVTTRLQNVADIMRTLPSHCLKGLSEEHCWLLFRSRVFGRESEDEEQKQPNLGKIGRQIVRKCVGVPLVAKVLGGLLRFKRQEKEWIHVEKSEIWNLPDDEAVILQALRLSYHHLPLELRRCFAYSAVFPKDSKMEKQELIFHWMAHGCISSSEVKEVEDVGDQVWNELVLRSFFQEVDTRGRETIFKMHDLVHDLAQSIMENKVPRSQMKQGMNSKIREVYLGQYLRNSSSSIALNLPTLTTITNYTRLRSLKLNWARVKKLPKAIGKLKHLRFLDLAYSDICSLPRTFCSLLKLEILILNNCVYLETLPKHIRYMNNLRHIFLEGCSKLNDMPSRIKELTCLKTLSLFIVGYKVGNQLDQLQLLNLGGRLELRHLERTKNYMIATKTNLVNKPNLRYLALSWGDDNALEESANVMNALEPHSNLETLQISGFKGSCFPLWLEKMKNLTEIRLEDCQIWSHLPLGDLPRLKRLFLWRVDGLEYIYDQNEIQRQTLPSLEEVSLAKLPNLKGLLKEEMQGLIMFPNLRKLCIQHCEELAILPLPAMPNLEHLSIVHCTLSSFSRAKLQNLTYLQLHSTSCSLDDAWESLSKLRELEVWDAGEAAFARDLWFRGLKSLKKLQITNLKTVGRSIPRGSLRPLTALEELQIYGFWELDEVAEEFKDLHLLKRLELRNLNGIVSLPQGLQHLSSLESLKLLSLPLLSSLPEWLVNLMSLRELDIQNCPNLTSLPSTMPNLTSLTILDCLQLGRRCEKEKGQDWNKIAHIPHPNIHHFD